MRIEMRLLDRRNVRPLLILAFGAAMVFFAGVNQFAQTRPQLPARTAHVNDFAGVVSETARQQMENVLANVKQKTGIEFDIAVVESTSGQDIFDYSRQLADDWNVGARTSAKKSLLLVLAVNEKASFTRFSRSVQNELPEGVLGQMSQLMRANVNAGQFSEGLQASVQHFASAMATKLGLGAADFAKAPAADLTANFATADPSPNLPTSDTSASKEPRETPVADAPVNLPSPVATTPGAPASSTPAPTTGTRPRSVTLAENAAPKTTKPETRIDATIDEDELEEVELTLTKPLEPRIRLLKTFLAERPDSKARARAMELLVSAHAALGDDRLKKGDSAGGVEQLMLAIADAPVNASDKLFTGVIAQIPLNLYLRGEHTAANKAAQTIEEKFGADPKRLLGVSSFYLGTEQGNEAVRIATQAVKIAPDMADAHQALGLGLHISLRLDEAAGEYRRALELDPNSKAARRTLADLSRASGKAEEALTLYRQQLAADAADKAARAGLVLSLLELGRQAEAKSEFDRAIETDSRNLALVAGVAYWYAAHNEVEAALSFGTRAIELEPRYTWSYVALSRALIAQQKPLDAERAIRSAREHGKFSTLEYELATTLVSAGLYDEASEILVQSFGLKDNQIETRLAGRTPARGLTFIDLLAPERRASVFQFTAADNEGNARILKALLTFAAVINQGNNGGSINEENAVAAAKEFSSGDDALRVYRQLYAANQLLRKGIAFQTVYELAQAARSSAEAGLNIPVATVAVQAEEYRDIRARAIGSGSLPGIAEAPRNVLSNLLRGRIEDLSGWALYNQDKLAEAADHLDRAANILPEGTPAWRNALWHRGAVLDGLGKKEEALASYIRSYNAGDPDAARRGVIEQLYRKINGSLAGLEARIDAAPGAAPANEPSARPNATNDATTPVPQAVVTAAATPTPEMPSSPVSESQTQTTTSQSTPEAQRSREPQPNATPSSPEPGPSPVSTPPSDTTPINSPNVTPTRARATVTVTGQVKDSQNNPIGNVVVVLISPQGTVLASTTDEQGNYSFTVVAPARGYRIIPSKDGLMFDPADKNLPVVSDDLKQLDFIGTAVPKP